ncbi:YwhD family protein [Alkalibacillus haloalkaliphilus]|uniref:YwhD family protein n=1 Tax=Alkalibacillus haloalkaliphilus TaxID=94136 RepID=UPI0029355E30|nr:YwhD family protein [Alkalibacillus haloalkaliphilus]MDV2583142.1 YwhD family protein [Alkalibacillus haloalkaliphilus]
MADENNQEKKSSNKFTIMKDDPIDGHPGYSGGGGAFSLENMSPLIVDPNEDRVWVDMGAMHARSEVEKRIKFVTDQEEVPNGKPYWIVWVTVERGEHGPYYYGVAACYLEVDREARRGYKVLAEHVNRMDKSLKGKIILEHMDDHSKALLRDFLKDFNEQYWELSTDELKDVLK